MSIPVGLQLYSVRNDCAQDLLGVIAQVAEMGYKGVEFAGYHGHSASAIRAALDAAGIVACGTHTSYEALKDDQFDATVELHKTLGTNNVIIPWLPETMRNTPEACAETAAWLSDVSAKLREVGLRTGFHCHDGDMKPLSDGVSAWMRIGQATPSNFLMQYDTANGMHGGADPVQPILDLPGRSQSTHLKGYNDGFGALVGEPSIPWEKVFEACETVGGTEWYVVEHEEEGKYTPLEAVAQCLANLKALGKA